MAARPHSQEQFDDEHKSFLVSCDQDSNLLPHELSGDQNAQKSVLLSDVEKDKANFLLTVTTIMKTVIGAGILSLPYTVANLGYIFSLIIFAIVIAGTYFSSVLLLNAKNLSHHSNFASILDHLFHSKLARALGSLFILLNNIGICIAELTIFKGSIRKIIEDTMGVDELNNWYLSGWFIVLVMACIELPLTLPQKIQKLKIFAFFGVSGILVFILLFVIYFFIEMSELDFKVSHELNAFPTDWFHAASVIPNLLLALSYQMNFFPIFKGMKNTSDDKMKKAALAGIGGCGLSYLIVGILGYIVNGGKQGFQANFLLSIGYGDTNRFLFFGMNIGFLISVTFSFPIMFFGARNNFIAILQQILAPKTEFSKKRWRDPAQADNIQMISSYIQGNQSNEARRRKAYYLFLLYTFLLFFIAVCVAMLVDDIEVVFNIVGAICSTSIGCLLPCMFYIMLVKKKKKPITCKFYVAALYFGVMLPYAIFSIVAKYVREE